MVIIETLSIMILSILTLSITPLSTIKKRDTEHNIMLSITTLSMNDTQYERHSAY